MSIGRKTIAQRLLEARVAINNSINTPLILAAVTPYGYDLLRLQAALALHDEVQRLDEAQSQEYGDQYGATVEVQQAWAAAKSAYIPALKIARIAFRDDHGAQQALGLGGVRKQSLGGWLEQAALFFNNLLRNEGYLAVMLPFSFDVAKLTAGSALVTALDEANERQEQNVGDAQKATQLRDKKLDELDQWMADYKTVAVIALADTPQETEKLGWVAPS